MQIKRHCLLIEVMHSEDFFSGVGVFASSGARIPSSQAICQTPSHTNHRSTSATVHPRARGSDNDHR